MADFSDFQLKEYENISQAHFKTNELIVAFFRYYLLIMALPISFLGAGFASATEAQKVELLSNWQNPTATFLLVIGLLGFFMMCYLTGLRTEALLYAKTVNAVRKYFFDNRGGEVLGANNEVTHMLPIKTDKPKMTKPGDHIWIVLSFTAFNSLYLVSGWMVWSVKIAANDTNLNQTGQWPTAACIMVFFVTSAILHIAAHFILSFEKDRKWQSIDHSVEKAKS